MYVGPRQFGVNYGLHDDATEAVNCVPGACSNVSYASYEQMNGAFVGDSCHRMYDARSHVNHSKATRAYQFHSGYGRPNGSTYDAMDSSMDASSSLSLSSTDTKPDISQLSINTSPNSFANVMGLPSSSRYPSMSSHGYPTQSGGAPLQPGFFDMGLLGGMSPGGPPLQSPSLHSQSSMSPVHLHSPGSLTSPSTSFPSIQSPTSTMGPPYHPGQNVQAAMNAAAHFSASTKHICAICGDRASGKHYGVYSCEGCKGFFKRTVRKDLQYACRDEKSCLIDKRQRNRCQYCRYMKCLATGMKREAVQEERQRAKERGDEVESTTSANSEMPVEMILDAEMALENQLDVYTDNPNDIAGSFVMAAEKQMYALVDWAKRIPHFTELSLEDQVILLRTGWNELLIAGFAHQSMSAAKDCIVLANGLQVHRANAHEVGLELIFDRILTEIVSKMKEMVMDKTELGCLRAIVLFNPDAKGLNSVQAVESLREKVYATLEEFCKLQNPDEPGRFAKLLLRLPALRSIGLKCTELLFSNKLMGDNSAIETFLLDMLENPNPSN